MHQLFIGYKYNKEKKIMPLLTKTNIEPTLFKGLGLFTAEDLYKGSIIYADNKHIDKIISETERLQYPEPLKTFITTYASFNIERNEWYLCIDDARFFNHEENNPNTFYNKETGEVIALRDIRRGEELTSNYREFCDYCAMGDFGFEVK